jgi:hypothetical protein
MPDSWITALIGAGGTIVGAAVPVVARWMRERNVPFVPIVTDRQRSIAGEWRGTGGDLFVENGGPSIQLAATFSLRISGRSIIANALVTAEVPVRIVNSLSMKGGFFNENLIQLKYMSKDGGRIQYGVILLELTAAGNRLHGHYAGFSPTRECLIVGHFEMEKVPS